MSSIPVFEAKTRLSELLTLVNDGAAFTITRQGVAVARLVPVAAAPAGRGAAARRKSVDAAVSALEMLRPGVTLDLPLKDANAQGRG